MSDDRTNSTGPMGFAVDLSEQLEELLLRFDRAWNETRGADLREYLRNGDDPAFVAELICIDMTRRKMQGLPIEPSMYEELLSARAMSAVLDVESLRLEVIESDRRRREAGIEPPANGVPDARERISFPEEPLEICARYERLETHEQGGLGEIFVATDAGLNRRVAVKVLQEKWRTSERAGRNFLQEAEVTARLDHPGVIPIHNLGRTVDGRPCYSMRYVHGETLAAAGKRYWTDSLRAADERAVAFRGLLSRFASLCNTIAYAHSQGVLHRDIKPANVMLGPFGETIVLDWGLSKVLRDATESESPATAQYELSDGKTNATGDVLGTPAYLSPEQAKGRYDLVGPATDVFGLGATLYEMLTGAAPYSGGTTEDALHRARSAVHVAPHVSNPAAPRALCEICSKAMALDPADRYASAIELAADVERWQAGEAVSVWDDPWYVRVERFARRRKATFGGLCVLFLVVPVLVGTAAWFVATARGEAELSRQAATAKEGTAVQVTSYLVDLLKGADAFESDGVLRPVYGDRERGLIVRQILQRASVLADEHLIDQPRQRAEILTTVGNIYRNMGVWDEAESHLKHAYETLSNTDGIHAPSTVASMMALARLAHDSGDYRTADKLYRDVLRDRRQTFGDESLEVAEAKYFLGCVTFDRPFSLETPQFDPRNRKQAESLLLDSLAVRRRLLPKNHPDIGHTLVALGNMNLNEWGQRGLAADYAQRALQVFRASERDSTLGAVTAEMVIAEKDRLENRLAEAEITYLRVLEVLRKRLGREHPLVLQQLMNLVGLYNKKEDFGRALEFAREILQLMRATPRFRSQPPLVDGMILFADRILNQGDAATAEGYYREALGFAKERPQDNAKSIQALEARIRLLPSVQGGQKR